MKRTQGTCRKIKLGFVMMLLERQGTSIWKTTPSLGLVISERTLQITWFGHGGSQTFLILQFSKDVPKCPLDPALLSQENIFGPFFWVSHQIWEGWREDFWEGPRDEGLSQLVLLEEMQGCRPACRTGTVPTPTPHPHPPNTEQGSSVTSQHSWPHPLSHSPLLQHPVGKAPLNFLLWTSHSFSLLPEGQEDVNQPWN